MRLIFDDDSGTPQQRAWVNEAVKKMSSFPYDQLGAEVTVAWAPGTPCGMNHTYMCTTALGTYNVDGDPQFSITIEDWADDPTNRENRGLPNPAADIKDFYMQSFVHETGHVAQDAALRTDSLKTQACVLFWRLDVNAGSGRRYGTLADYSPDETAPGAWANSIQEAISEAIKCSFYKGRLIYRNRTNWHIDAEDWPKLMALLTFSIVRGQVDNFNGSKADEIAAGRITRDSIYLSTGAGHAALLWPYPIDAGESQAWGRLIGGGGSPHCRLPLSAGVGITQASAGSPYNGMGITFVLNIAPDTLVAIAEWPSGDYGGTDDADFLKAWDNNGDVRTARQFAAPFWLGAVIDIDGSWVTGIWGGAPAVGEAPLLIHDSGTIAVSEGGFGCSAEWRAGANNGLEHGVDLVQPDAYMTLQGFFVRVRAPTDIDGAWPFALPFGEISSGPFAAGAIRVG